MNAALLEKESETIAVQPPCSRWNSEERAAATIESILHQAEKDERNLAYHTLCKSEKARKQSGSYYTPVDVANFFWNQFFDARSISTPKEATAFLHTHRFIEPSCGSGVLVFALLKKLLDLGVSLNAMRNIDLSLVDLNAASLQYCKHQFEFINNSLGRTYFTPRFEHSDFLNFKGLSGAKPVVIFGNPPFVANPKGAAWKNRYADFMDRCLEHAKPLAAIHFIVPLSLAFSRDFSALRQKIRSRRYAVFASHFDNMPDTLFKSGKPQNGNSNKANSQRCTIVSVLSASDYCLHCTRLYRWKAADREALLSGNPEYEDVTNYNLSDQFIRPFTARMASYLQMQRFRYCLGDLAKHEGRHDLHIGSVARNYISIRAEAGNGVQSFSFEDRLSFYRFLGLITSDVFMDYWRSVGDGFHVTRANVLDFPVSSSLDKLTAESIPQIKSMWARRRKFEKAKLNSGFVVRSYDFSNAAPTLYPALPRISGRWRTRNEEI